jgi:hypothetical protein
MSHPQITIAFFIDDKWWLNTSDLFNRTNIRHMTTSASRRLNILCIKFKISSFFIATLFVQLYVRVDILLTSENNLHNRMIPLERSLVHKTQITLPLCIEVPVPSQESEQCGHVFHDWRYQFDSFYDCLLEFGTIQTYWGFFVFVSIFMTLVLSSRVNISKHVWVENLEQSTTKTAQVKCKNL